MYGKIYLAQPSSGATDQAKDQNHTTITALYTVVLEK